MLDTNALLWLYKDSSDLGAQARQKIVRATRVHFSAASIMEISIKHMLGRLPLPGGEGFPEVFIRSGLVELPLTSAHAAAMTDFPELTRHDPFDRMLVAQAASEAFELLTSDATLLAQGRGWITDARR
nr:MULTISPECIES: type II toxin-antitoxin system VapC family toxin [Microbacterium]